MKHVNLSWIRRWKIKKYWERKNPKISSPQYKSELWKAIEGNKDLKLNVHEQLDDIKHLKEQCDIDDEDEVQEITAAITPMKKKKSVCVTCNRIFVTKKMGWKNISRKSTLSSGEIIVAKCSEKERK